MKTETKEEIKAFIDHFGVIGVILMILQAIVILMALVRIIGMIVNLC
jgi:hypothetical protein